MVRRGEIISFTRIWNSSFGVRDRSPSTPLYSNIGSPQTNCQIEQRAVQWFILHQRDSTPMQTISQDVSPSASRYLLNVRRFDTIAAKYAAARLVGMEAKRNEDQQKPFII